MDFLLGLGFGFVLAILCAYAIYEKQNSEQHSIEIEYDGVGNVRKSWNGTVINNGLFSFNDLKAVNSFTIVGNIKSVH